MYNIIPFILILISLGVIIVIVGRKFSILANIDVDSIQSEREAKFKEQIISNRLKRNFLRYYSKTTRILKPAGKFSADMFQNLYNKLLEYREEYKEQAEAETVEENAVEKMFAEIDEFLEKEDLAQAESSYIKIISLDSKNIKAFRGLGKLYFERKDFNEAKQTYEHAIRLLEKDYDNYSVKPATEISEAEKTEKEKVSLNLSGSYFDLSLTQKAMENYPEALASVDKALSIEANNPRFLDTKLEISIIIKDKALATETLEKLKQANPENAKLSDFEKQISEIKTETES